MNDVEACLKNLGLRVTQPRLEVIKVLVAADRPMSAEDILQALPKKSLDLVTIYRNMSLFAENGLVQVIQLESGKQLFELMESGEHHHHIVCRACHRTVRLDLCFGGELEKMAQAQGFSELSHTIEVFGVCGDCSQTASK